jgi:hypothetical protein
LAENRRDQNIDSKVILKYNDIYGGLAQLGEHQAGSLGVKGSNPLSSILII